MDYRSLTYYNSYSVSNPNYNDAFLNFLQGRRLARYNANLVGAHIYSANSELINTVETGFGFIDQSLTAILQEQINTNILLENIGELLRLPDSEKQRQLHIERGLKFSIQANKDADLALDAKPEFEAALKLMPQDWFVLQQLGILLSFNEKVLDLETAKSYFLKAAKYAKVDSVTDGNNFINNLFRQNLTAPVENTTTKRGLDIFVVEAYLNAALISYVQSEFVEAVNSSLQALSVDPDNPKVLFLVAKYLVRDHKNEEALDYLKKAISIAPYLCVVVSQDADLLTIPNITAFCSNFLNDFYARVSLIQNRIAEVNEFINNPEVFKISHGFDYKNKIIECCRILNEPLVSEVYTEEDMELDPLFEECALMVIEMQSGSTSNIQRRLNLGYNRAERIMAQLEKLGIVGPQNGTNPGIVYCKTKDDLGLFMNAWTPYRTLHGYFVNDLVYKWDSVKYRCNDFQKKFGELKRVKLLNSQPQVQEKPKPEGCFIATAAIGNENHPVIVDLRIFRDSWLSQRKWGKDFIRWYYLHGPKAAKIISKRAAYRAVTLWLLIKPVHFVVKKSFLR